MARRKPGGHALNGPFIYFIYFGKGHFSRFHGSQLGGWIAQK
jgi:hypothetical protein